MENFYTYDMTMGKFIITANDNSITRILKSDGNFNTEGYILKENKIIRQAFFQLTEYFLGERKIFTLPLDPKGTDFQRLVWDQLKQIPYGQTRSYKDIGRSIGNENASRAIGGANGKNPILIMIPCHRVIQQDGGLGGFSSGIGLKKNLLELENKYSLYSSE